MILLKQLNSEDVSVKYLSWLNPDESPFIEYCKNNSTIKELKNYVSEREKKSDILFLGIFTKNRQHIGNIKYEPIDFKKNTAVMGILIGDSNWRGKGVASEVIHSSAHYLAKKYQIETITLGVKKTNYAAQSTYKNIGFKIERQIKDDILMTWLI